MKVLLIFAACISLSLAAVSYSGNQVWRLKASEEKDRAQLHATVALLERKGVDVWAHSNDWADVMVDENVFEEYSGLLKNLEVDYHVSIFDVQKLINEENERRRIQPYAFSLEHYNSYDDIDAYMRDLPGKYSNVELLTIGQSFENRDLLMAKISTGAGKKAIWFDCGIHAREWITPATCLYGLDHFAQGNDPEFNSLLDMYDVYIMPVQNPDGYEYTHAHDRLWRKNRHHYPNDTCAGIDLNRNFDEHWGGLGTSGSSCSDSYRGPSPASEPEIQATSAKITEMAGDLQALYSIHSYSQLWMFAYGWSYDLPPDVDELNAASLVGVNALNGVHGTSYDYGPIASTIYPAAGTTVDFGYTAGIVHSYTLELRDTGHYGFLLPESEITPTAEETWTGLIESIKSM